MDVPGHEQRSAAVLNEGAEGRRLVDEDDIGSIVPPAPARPPAGNGGQTRSDIGGVLLAALEGPAGRAAPARAYEEPH